MSAQNPARPSEGRLRIGTSQHFDWLHGIVKAVLVLNGLDAVFTLIWVGSGLAREGNPFLNSLVHEHPTAFVVAKLALVSLGSLLLWRHRERPAAVVAIFAAFLVYYLVLLLHVGFLSALVGRLLGL